MINDYFESITLKDILEDKDLTGIDFKCDDIFIKREKNETM